jgi:type VI secretion system protein ImpJ
VLLSPQQFQQQARWEAWSNENLARLQWAHPWGVLAADFDSEALRLGKLQATRLTVRLPDGTLIDTDTADALPPALDLSQLPTSAGQGATLVLALPLEQANGRNCLPMGERVDRPTRYRQTWKKVQDLYGDEVESVAVLQHDLSLRLTDSGNHPYVTCPLARLVQDGQGGWVLDPSFVPPLLSLAAHPGLVAQLDNLLTQLSAKRERLMGMRQESNQRMADFAVADVSLFWLLNALNTYQPVLADLKQYPARHPEQVYGELVKLAGALLTFSLEHGIEQIPVYQHEGLGCVLPPLMGLISSLLEASLPSRVIALEVRETAANHWQARLDDPRLREPGAADFYLSVRCRMPAAQVHIQFPRLCKVGAPDDVRQLVNAALDGVPLHALAQVPAPIALRLENQYFAVDLAHPKGQAVLAEGLCAFYVPTTLTEAKLELFAVLRT